MSEINLHSGGELVSFADLHAVKTPEATATHHPLPHHELVNMVKFSLSYHGHDVVEEQHALDKDGNRYFGILTLKSAYGDYTDVCGLRNSHDRAYPAGIAFGSSVFVCSNLAFISDHVLKRKHTKNLKRDLVGLIAGVVEPLQDIRQRQNQTFERYRTKTLELDEFDHLVIELYRRGGLNITRVPDVLSAFQSPPHDWGEDPTYWRFYNAVTYALRGKIAEAPHLTQVLHEVIDAQFEPVDTNQLLLPNLAAAE